MPIESHDFNGFVVRFHAGKKSFSARIKISSKSFSGKNKQKDHTNGHMGAMETSNHKEERTKLGSTKMIAPRSKSANSNREKKTVSVFGPAPILKSQKKKDFVSGNAAMM